MTTQTVTLPDDLGVLDFQPPCGYGHGPGSWEMPACEYPADWALTARHCSAGVLRCNTHMEYAIRQLRDGPGVTCPECWRPTLSPATLTDAFPRIERLR